MPYFKLVASGHSEVQADEIVLKRDDYGDVELSLSTTVAREIPDNYVEATKASVERLGFSVVDAEEPASNAQPGSQLAELQEVGTDILGTAPLLTGNTQEGNETPVPVEQGTAEAAAAAPTPSAAQSAPSRTISS